MRRKNETLYCSFCSKSQHEVRKLIAGPAVFICDECVKLCTNILREELPKEKPKARRSKKEIAEREREARALERWQRKTKPPVRRTREYSRRSLEMYVNKRRLTRTLDPIIR
jgi:hypothetical protein